MKIPLSASVLACDVAEMGQDTAPPHKDQEAGGTAWDLSASHSLFPAPLLGLAGLPNPSAFF